MEKNQIMKIIKNKLLKNEKIYINIKIIKYKKITII